MSKFSVFKPIPVGALDEYRISLYGIPRLTSYQQLCLRIADKVLEATIIMPEKPGQVLRSVDQLDAATVERLILQAIPINALAAMIILDAVDYFSEGISFLNPKHQYECFDTSFKRRYTDKIMGYAFVFQVPAGGELKLFSEEYDEGHYGVGTISRCHLSQSTTHQNFAWGGYRDVQIEDTYDRGYFGIPCQISGRLKRTPVHEADELWESIGVTGTIPYDWIIQRALYETGQHVPKLIPAPNKNEILATIEQAIQALAKRLEESAQPEIE